MSPHEPPPPPDIHPGMPSFVLPYTCSACGVTTLAEVHALTPPEDLVSARSLQVLRDSKSLREQLSGTLEPDPKIALYTDILKNEATSRLRHATCPACAQRNPAGLATIAKERRTVRLIGVALVLAFTLLAWWWPPFALVFAALTAAPGLVFAIVNRARGEPVPVGTLALNLSLSTTIALVALLLPPYAWIGPLLAQLVALLRTFREDDRWPEPQITWNPTTD